jgi:hypothetical protein
MDPVLIGQEGKHLFPLIATLRTGYSLPHVGANRAGCYQACETTQRCPAAWSNHRFHLLSPNVELAASAGA